MTGRLRYSRALPVATRCKARLHQSVVCSTTASATGEGTGAFFDFARFRRSWLRCRKACCFAYIAWAAVTMPAACPLKSKRGAFSTMLAQYRAPRHHVEMPSLSCSRVIPSSSKCCSASLRMPSLSGTLGAGLTGNANGKCFCNGQIASTAGSSSRGLACGGGLPLDVCRAIGLYLLIFCPQAVA